MLMNICFYRYMNDPVKNPPLDCESISNDLERSGNLNRKICFLGRIPVKIQLSEKPTLSLKIAYPVSSNRSMKMKDTSQVTEKYF